MNVACICLPGEWDLTCDRFGDHARQRVDAALIAAAEEMHREEDDWLLYGERGRP